MTKLEELRQKIDAANDNYYNKGISTVTDYEFELMLESLLSLCPDDPRLKSVGVPPTLDKVDHEYPMGSLDNIDASNSNELEVYLKRVRDITNGAPHTFHMTPKIDGSSIAITYKSGVLVSAVTRGNGYVGQDITSKVQYFKQVPLQLTEPLDIVVRGEVVMHRDDFVEYINTAELEGVRNPRNTGNGIVVRKDCRGAGLVHFYAFNAIVKGRNYDTVSMAYAHLKSLGFTTPPEIIVTTITDIQVQMSAFLTNNYPYDVDGMVIRMNEFKYSSLYNEDGDDLRPRSDRAIKFNSQKAETTITGVTVTVGHSGKLTPTLTVQPVQIGGVTVSNVLIYNFEEPARLCLGINDKIQIVLAGDIIPKVLSVVDKSTNSIPINKPTVCPVCGHKVEHRELLKGESVDVFCQNIDCPGIKLVKIKNFVGSSKRGMGILGIGDQLIEMLVNMNIVNNPSDFYKLTVEQLEPLQMGNGKVGFKRAETICGNIQDSKENSVAQVISSLGIETLGLSRANLMIELANGKLNNLEDWLNASDVITNLSHKDLPQSHLSMIVQQISLISDEILRLVAIGVGKAELKLSTNSLPFDGISFCFTGTRELENIVVDLGGKIASGVSKNLQYLVQKDKNSVSSKSQKAKVLGVNIIGIDELRIMIEKVSPGLLHV